MDNKTFTFNDDEIETLLDILGREVPKQEKAIREVKEEIIDDLISPRLVASLETRLSELNALIKKLGGE